MSDRPAFLLYFERYGVARGWPAGDEVLAVGAPTPALEPPLAAD